MYIVMIILSAAKVPLVDSISEVRHTVLFEISMLHVFGDL